MLETTCCPDCGAELPTGATGGLCPRCLLGAGISSDSPFESPADSPFAATTPQAGGFVPPTPASLAGYFPDLEVLEIIGQGGMGAVYKARQTKLDRLVALKIIRPESADDPAFAERFTREAKTLARLNHSNIVSIHDFGEFEPAASGLAAESTPSDTSGPTSGSVGDRPQHEERPQTASRKLFYFVMEFVDGANLRQLMESGQLQASQSLAIVPQICDALQYAHDEGVIHRDIKPENILIDRRGRVKIADFGLAKLAGQSPENFTLTGTHQVMGTPRYMAPEQMSGSRLVDHRADIYSLGVVLYEMLTGELPMGRFEAPSHKAAVDARLDDVVHRALESNPDRRYQRASEIRTDMESIALDALSHGELESVDASVASGFPGPSTIMERQVAGVVNWLKGGRTPDGAPRSATVFAGDRPSIRQTFSRKAIIGAFWAPLFLLAVVGFTVTSDAMVHRPDGNVSLTFLGLALTVAAAVVGILGLLAPFATTILGMLAISDIRHEPARIRGLGLAYFDAVFFPLLVLDAVMLFSVGALVAIVFQAGISSMFAVALGGPICLLLDAVLAVWGWRLVSRSVPSAWEVPTPPPVVPHSGVSNVTRTPLPAPEPAQAADVPIFSPAPTPETNSTATSLQLRRIEMRLKAPAAGLIVVALLHLIFWSVVGYSVLFEAWGLQHGRLTASPGELLGGIAATIAVLLVLGAILQGARHLRRLTGIGWCYAAAILCVIPWSAASVVGLFIGVWVFNVLGDSDVKEAFVQRSLELERRN